MVPFGVVAGPRELTTVSPAIIYHEHPADNRPVTGKVRMVHPGRSGSGVTPSARPGNPIPVERWTPLNAVESHRPRVRHGPSVVGSGDAHNATGLTPGTYRADLVVRTNDPLNRILKTIVTMMVTN